MRVNTSIIRTGGRCTRECSATTFVHGRSEHDQRRLTVQRARRDQHSVEPCVSRLRCELLAAGRVVCDQLIGADAELVANVSVGEVEYGEAVDLGTTDATPHFERRNLTLAPVSKQLGPRPALGEGRIPDAWLAGSVVAPVVRCRVLELKQGVARACLVPDSAGDLAGRDVLHQSFVGESRVATASYVCAVGERDSRSMNCFGVALSENIQWSATVERPVVGAEPLADAARAQ